MRKSEDIWPKAVCTQGQPAANTILDNHINPFYYNHV